MHRGTFITLEGGEGTGKTTQGLLLAERLRSAGLDVVLTREPGGAPFAERLRDLILSEKPQAQLSEMLVFAAARAEHLEVTVRPALALGQVVICDRFIDSTRVYQGTLGGLAPDTIGRVEQVSTAGLLPALTLVFDADVGVARVRAATRGGENRFDAAQSADYDAIRRGFLDIAAQEPDRCRVVDASQAVEAVAADVWRIVSSRFAIDCWALGDPVKRPLV